MYYFQNQNLLVAILKDELTNTSVDQRKYLFEELYLTTKIQAKNEYQDKDKFFLKGYFKSETSRGISLRRV